MKVYDKDGAEYDKAPVDARECVSQLGWTLEAEEKVEDQFTDLTANKLKDFLTAADVEFKSNATKSDLLVLCREIKD